MTIESNHMHGRSEIEVKNEKEVVNKYLFSNLVSIC